MKKWVLLFIALLLCGVNAVAYAGNVLSREAAWLAPYHIPLIQQGDTFLIVIPANLLFPSDSTRLLPSAADALDTVANVLRHVKKIDVTISGYTDELGNAARNLALSEKQAQYVAEYLWAAGVDARLQTALGYGEAEPIADNDSYWGRAQNRRIEIRFRRVD